jgi:hypothetical protein
MSTHLWMLWTTAAPHYAIDSGKRELNRGGGGYVHDRQKNNFLLEYDFIRLKLERFALV